MKIKIKDANRHLAVTTGYGQISIYTAKALYKLKHDVYYDFITGCVDELLDRLAKKSFKHTPDTIYLWIRPPHYIKGKDFNPKHINVFYTMHETDSFEGWKSDWPQLLNKCTAVIVPSQWNKEIFIRHGITVQIYVVPLAVTTKTFHGVKTNQFSILSLHEGLGKRSSRENWWDSIETYLRTFCGRNCYDVVYWIKTWNADVPGFHSHVEKFIASEGLDRSALPPYQVWEVELLPEDMSRLYGTVWLFLKNANREGWSLPLHEAMACGTNILASDIPPFREFVYPPMVDYFGLGDCKALGRNLRAQFKRWQQWKSHVNRYKPDHVVKELEGILKGILNNYQKDNTLKIN